MSGLVDADRRASIREEFVLVDASARPKVLSVAARGRVEPPSRLLTTVDLSGTNLGRGSILTGLFALSSRLPRYK
jgi:hypothetical protein